MEVIQEEVGWGCTSVIVLQLALLQAQVLQVVQALVLGAGRGLRQPVRKDWFLPSTHMHPPLPICPTLSLTKRHCHICSICFYATSTSCIRYNLSVGLKKRNEPEMSNLNSLALEDCMNWWLTFLWWFYWPLLQTLLNSSSLHMDSSELLYVFLALCQNARRYPRGGGVRGGGR